MKINETEEKKNNGKTSIKKGKKNEREITKDRTKYRNTRKTETQNLFS
jgi:hypothetical protein